MLPIEIKNELFFRSQSLRVKAAGELKVKLGAVNTSVHQSWP
jgi:hypothetical protein